MIIDLNTMLIESTIHSNLSQNERILNRNGKEWYDDFCANFTIDELYEIQQFIYAHHVEHEYDLNDCDDVSEMIYDYIKWWVFDLIDSGDTDQAKAVLNAGYI